MRTKDSETLPEVSEVKFIQYCLICRRGVVSETPKGSSIFLSKNRSVLLSICGDCKKKYLDVGVALVNPETESVIVIMDGAFKSIFNQALPEQKIIRVEEEVIEQIYTLFKIFQVDIWKGEKSEQILKN